MDVSSDFIYDYKACVILQSDERSLTLMSKCSEFNQSIHSFFMNECLAPQTRGNFCGLASIASIMCYLLKQCKSNILKHINIDALIDQERMFISYISKHQFDIRRGLSLIQVVHIISAMISDFKLPFYVDYISTTDLNLLQNSFYHDLQLMMKNEKENENDIENEGKNENKSENEKDISSSTLCMAILSNFWRNKRVKVSSANGKSKVLSKILKGGGHWSPIINVTSDLEHVFIADVNNRRLVPHWISTKGLLSLMNTCHIRTNSPRGYIRICHQNYYDCQLLQKPISISLSLSSINIAIKKSDHECLHLRLATIKDIFTLARIQVRAWQKTYKGIIDDDFLFHSSSMTVERKYKKWREIICNSKKLVIVLCMDTKILGYCTIGLPSKSSIRKLKEVPIIDGEMFTLYLSVDCPQRQGFGTYLFDIGYRLIQCHFDWKILLAEYEQIMNNKDCSSILFNKKCVFCVWLLGNNKIAMNFYLKKGCAVVLDHQKAHFGKKSYRYTGMIYDKLASNVQTTDYV